MEKKTVQLVKEYGFQPRRKLSVQDGAVLPGKFEPFPSRLYGRPLEEIDSFIYDEVRTVIALVCCGEKRRGRNVGGPPGTIETRGVI
jgi:hypothetical protein